MNIYSIKKEELEEELVKSENDIAMDSNLQNRKEMADMFNRMISQEYQEQRIIDDNRKRFIKKNIERVGL